MTIASFPDRKIVYEDRTESLWRDVAMIADEFSQAAEEAHSLARLRQIRDRLQACISLLTLARNEMGDD